MSITLPIDKELLEQVQEAEPYRPERSDAFARLAAGEIDEAEYLEQVGSDAAVAPILSSLEQHAPARPAADDGELSL